MATVVPKVVDVVQNFAAADGFGVRWAPVALEGYSVLGYRVYVALAGALRWGADQLVLADGTVATPPAAAAVAADMVSTTDSSLFVVKAVKGAYAVRVAALLLRTADNTVVQGPLSDYQAAPYIRNDDRDVWWPAVWARCLELSTDARAKVAVQEAAAVRAAATLKTKLEEERRLQGRIEGLQREVDELKMRLVVASGSIESNRQASVVSAAEKVKAAEARLAEVQAHMKVAQEQLTTARTEAEATRADMRRELEDHNAKLAERVKELNAMRERVLSEMDEKKAALNAELADIQVQVDTTKMDKAHLDQQVAQLRQELKALQGGLEAGGALQAEVDALQAIKEEMQRQIDILNAESAAAQSEATAARTDADQLRTELAASQQTAVASREESSRVASELEHAQEALQSTKEAVTRAESQLAAERATVSTQAGDLRRAQESLAAVEEQLQQAGSRVVALEAEVAAAQQSRRDTEAELSRMRVDAQGAKVEVAAKEAECRTLGDRIVALETEAAAARAELTAKLASSAEATRKVAELQAALDAAEVRAKAADEAEAQVAALTAEVSALRDHNATAAAIAAQAAEAATTIAKLNQELEAQRRRHEEASATIASLRAENADLNRVAELHETRSAELNAKVAAAEAAARAAADAAKASDTRASQLERELVTQRQALEAELRAAMTATAEAQERGRVAVRAATEESTILRDEVDRLTAALQQLDETAAAKLLELQGEIDRLSRMPRGSDVDPAEVVKLKQHVEYQRNKIAQLEQDKRNLEHQVSLLRHGIRDPTGALGLQRQSSSGGAGSVVLPEVSAAVRAWLATYSTDRDKAAALRYYEGLQHLLPALTDEQLLAAFQAYGELSADGQNARSTWLLDQS